MIEKALSFLINIMGDFVESLGNMHLFRGLSVLGVFLGFIVVGSVITFVFRK